MEKIFCNDNGKNNVRSFLRQFFEVACLLCICQISIGQSALYPSRMGVTGSLINVGIAGGSMSFNTSPSDNILYFGGTRATVISASTTQLSAIVPAGSFYGPVTYTDSNNLTAYSYISFLPIYINNSTAPFTDSSFEQRKSYAAGTGVSGIATADFDGDGKTDLAVINATSNTVAIFQNTGVAGNISFSPVTSYPTGNGASSVVTADINGDGKQDIVVTNSGSNTVSVFKNSSAGSAISFDNKVDFSTGNTPYSCCVNDFDGDGKTDIAVVNRSADNSISIFRNTGSGTDINFAARLNFATGNFPVSIVSGDLNQDGKPDIAVANYFGNTVSVLKSNCTPGIISFFAKVDYPTGSFPISVAIADITRDFMQDLVVANYVDNSISVLKHSQPASLVNFDAKADFAVGNGPIAIALSDVTGDGVIDISTINQNSNSVSVLKNTTVFNVNTPDFAEKTDIPAAASPFGIFSADFDTDGKPDIAGVGNDSFFVMRNKVSDGVASASVISCPDGLATFTSSLSGYTYKWQSDGASNGAFYFDLSPQDQSFTGVTSASMTIPDTRTFFNNWQFRCMVDGIAGNTFLLKITDTWTGASSTDWSDPNNWSCLAVPDINTNVIINNGTVTVNADVLCYSLVVKPGASLIVSPGFNVTVAH